MKTQVASLIALIATALSGVCCVLPMGLLALGFVSLGPLAVLMRYQAITTALSLLLSASAFYVVYRPGATADCAAGVCSPKSLRRSRWIVWVSAALMIVILILGRLPVRLAM